MFNVIASAQRVAIAWRTPTVRNGIASARAVAMIVSALLAAALLFCGASASAQTYPTKPVRFVIPFPAGGFSDVTGRLVVQKLSETIGQPIIFDNRPGASGNIGADIVAKSTPDGYTLLLNSINFVINPSVIKPPFDPVADFAGVSLIATGPPLVITVSASSPWKSIGDIVAAAKAQPGKLLFATSGLGSSPHVAVELLRATTGIDVVQVPYKGAALAMSSLLTGDISVVLPNLPVVLPHLKSGRVRAIAVTSAKRSPALPDLPTISEAGIPGFDIQNFIGLLAPAKTPRTIVVKLSSALASIAKQRDFVERYAELGMETVGSTPEQMDRFTREQIQKWSGVLKRSGYKPQ